VRLPWIAAAALAAAAAAWPGLASAQGIRNTAHDLSASSTIASGVKATTDNEICKFCHAPHKAQSSDLAWNHLQTANTTWNWGGATSTSSGTPLPTTNLRSSTRICLGCHDGTVSVGAVNNVGGGVGGTIAMATVAGKTDSTGKIIEARDLVGAAGNLSSNHPIGIPYAGQTGYNGVNSAIPAASVNNLPGGYWKVQVGGCASPTGVCTQATGAPLNGTRINLIPNVPNGTTNLGIECDTCHDPHNKYGLANFLRVEGTSSDALCRSCHNK
jgi:predicted CXXCH cytochrome family protein